MKYKLLGKSGLRVSELCLGAMTFGKEWGYGADKACSKKIFDTFLKAGGNFIDTANRYTEGTSEKYLGEMITTDRERLVIATKYSLYDRRDDPNSGGNHRKNLVQSVEGSLQRLKTDYIDLLYLHAWDGLTPEQEILRGLDDLVRAGKVLYLCISDTPAWIISRMNTMAELMGWSSFIALQIEYSLIQRTVERELLPMADALDIGITAWGSIAGGALSGKYLKNDPGRLKPDSKRLDERSTRIAEAVVAIAGEIGCSPVQVAISWVRQQGKVMIPVIGCRNHQQLTDNLRCLEVDLSPEQNERLDDISRVELGFPHDFLESSGVQDVIFGGMAGHIMNHRR